MAQSTSSNRKLIIALRVLLVMTLTLMALGAGVRTMNAGLSCPDWPLCFGKVIPDFHPGVWFEFVHRAYAGLVALVFAGVLVATFRSKNMPKGVKSAAIFALGFLTLQIVMGGLTVLLLVKEVVVTMHLMLATLFISGLFWMHDRLTAEPQQITSRAPAVLKYVAGFFAFAVLFQIMVGGFVASTYAGSVCVDWPLCNGQWVPTWRGAIGLQVIHRFIAYGLALTILVYSWMIYSARNAAWMSPRLQAAAKLNVLIVFLQVGVGVANLLFFIPAWLTVIHQSVAIVLLVTNIRLYLETRLLVNNDSFVSEPKAHSLIERQTVAGVSG